MGLVEDILRSKMAKLQVNYSNCALRAGFQTADFSEILSRAESVSPEENAAGTVTGSVSTVSAQYAAASPASAENSAVSGNSPYSDIIARAAAKYDIDPAVLKGMIRAESNFHKDSVSHAGAMGLMQLMPGTAKSLGVTDPFDPEQSIFGGAAYIRRQLNRFGDIRLALAAYNTGPHRVGSLNITDPDNASEYSKLSKGVRGYVDKVLSYAKQYA